MTPSRPRAEWPEVTLGGPQKPYIDRVVDDEPFLRAPKVVVTYGTVSGIPWTLTAFRTQPVGDCREHYRPVGPEMEFFLGLRGEYGGGGCYALIPKGAHLSLCGHFFGSLFPHVAAWVGFVADGVASLEAHRSDGERRSVEPSPGPPGFPDYFLLFPPRGIDTDVRAMSVAGDVLEGHRLRRMDNLTPDANAGTTINGVSWREGMPPPGWA